MIIAFCHPKYGTICKVEKITEPEYTLHVPVKELSEGRWMVTKEWGTLKQLQERGFVIYEENNK